MSVKEPTWSPTLKKHTCCNSIQSSYHRTGCPRATDRIPGRSSDPLFLLVRDLKAHGMTSGQVAAELKLMGYNIPLAQVNELYA